MWPHATLASIRAFSAIGLILATILALTTTLTHGATPFYRLKTVVNEFLVNFSTRACCALTRLGLRSEVLG